VVRHTVDDFLLTAASEHVSTTDWAKLSPTEWGELGRVATRHQLLPLVYYRLRQAGVVALIPAETRAGFQKSYLDNATDNMVRYHELARILRAFQSEQISVILLKGLHLAAVVYDNIGLRTMSDMDLLVPQKDVARAEAKLLGMGYVADPHNASLASWHFHSVYTLPAKHIQLELHWHIEPSRSRYSVDIEDLWQRVRSVSLGGLSACTFSAEDLLLHLTLHAATHHDLNGFGIRPLCDIAAVLQRYRSELDWSALIERARHWGIAKQLYLYLLLTHLLLGGGPPEDVLSAMRPTSFSPRYVTWARARLLAEGPDPNEPVVDNLMGIWTAQSARAKADHLLRAFFPSRRRMCELYALPPTSRWVFLYYPRRWADLFRRRAGEVWRLARRDPEATMFANREAGRTALMRWLSE
jgi:hypothetical protein